MSYLASNTKLSIILLTALALCLQLEAAPGYAEGQLLVKWRDGPESYAAAVGNAAIGSTVKRNFNEIGWQHVELPPGLSVRDGMEAYQQLGTVLAVEPDGIIEPILPPKDRSVGDLERGLQPASPDDLLEGEASTEGNASGETTMKRTEVRAPPPPPPPIIPNDPMFSQQWNLKKIGMTNAWSTTAGSTNIVVAIIDTGVDYTHPDLAANMWHNPGETGLDAQGRDKATNGIDDDGNGYVDDVHGVDIVNGTGDPMDFGYGNPSAPTYHGTLIAGVIGAVGNNSLGISGVNWSAQIMAIKMGEVFQLPSRAILSHFVAAWDYVLMMKRRGVNVRAINNSYGFAQTSAALADAISMAGDEGILAVFGAGNNGIDQDVFTVHFPNAFNLPSVINVTSSTESDTLRSDSNYGRSTVHLAAPGDNILSTIRGPGYQSNSGASYACPHVTGAAALLLAANPSLTVDQLKAALFGSVDQPAPLRNRVVTNGRLNLARALEYLGDTNPPAIVIYAAPAGQRTPTNATIQATFNRPMNRATVEAAFVVTPPINGTFAWTPDNRSFSFHNAMPFNIRTNYTVRIAGTAQDESGGSLDGSFNRTREGSPADDFTWTFRFPLPNDDFANAQVLTSASGSVAASNRYALLELEPSHADSKNIGASVWYRWTAPEPGGWFTFDLTSGTTFDSLLAVYTGDRLDQLVTVAGNDNYGTRISSRVSFAAAAGTNYSVVVAGKNASDPNQAGNFTLKWYPTPPPGFTGLQLSSSSGVPGAKITLFGTNFTGATSVLFNVTSASFTNALTNNFDLRITAVVPPDATSGPITIVTPHGNVTSTAIFQVLPPPLAIRLTGANELEITWPATSPEFVLEMSETLSAGSWTPITQLPVRANGQSKLTLTAPAEKRFYRLKRN